VSDVLTPKIKSKIPLHIMIKQWHLTSGVNFINILQAAFTHADSLNAQKRQSSQQCRLTVMGTTTGKGTRKMLVKLTTALSNAFFKSATDEFLKIVSHLQNCS